MVGFSCFDIILHGGLYIVGGLIDIFLLFRRLVANAVGSVEAGSVSLETDSIDIYDEQFAGPDDSVCSCCDSIVPESRA